MGGSDSIRVINAIQFWGAGLTQVRHTLYHIRHSIWSPKYLLLEAVLNDPPLLGRFGDTEVVPPPLNFPISTPLARVPFRRKKLECSRTLRAYSLQQFCVRCELQFRTGFTPRGASKTPTS